MGIASKEQVAACVGAEKALWAAIDTYVKHSKAVGVCSSASGMDNSADMVVAIARNYAAERRAARVVGDWTFPTDIFIGALQGYTTKMKKPALFRYDATDVSRKHFQAVINACVDG